MSNSELDWGQVPANPDPEMDLGYSVDDWEVLEARTAKSDCLMFLPSDEEMLRDNAFLIVEPDSLCELLKYL